MKMVGNAMRPKEHFTRESSVAKEPNMQLDLPEPIAAYFTADKEEGEAISQYFTETAVVKDEGHTYHGRAAIKQWKADASAKYQYKIEPFACERKDRKIVVTSRLTGNR
jgi:hypothetical protein